MMFYLKHYKLSKKEHCKKSNILGLTIAINIWLTFVYAAGELSDNQAKILFYKTEIKFLKYLMVQSYKKLNIAKSINSLSTILSS